MKNFNNAVKKNIALLATAGAIGLAAVTAGSLSSSTSTVSAATTAVSIKYDAVQVYNSPYSGKSTTGKWLAGDTSWKIFKTVKGSDGKTWFNLGGSQWIPASYTNEGTSTSTSSSSSKVQSVIALAQKQIGKPYVWGAKGPNAFDCSGLMNYCFKNALGMNIGGYTVPQESAGTKVSISNLKAGDLMFWGSAGATYHVALYVGNGKYIEAPKPGLNVRYSTISSYNMPSFGVRVL